MATKHAGQIPHERFLQIAEMVNSAETIQNLIEIIPTAIDVKMGSYHHFPAVGSVGFKNQPHYYSYKIPEEAIDLYNKYNMHKIDPGIKAAFSKGTFMRLSDMQHDPYIVENGHDTVIQMTLKITGDGLCIPLFGPNNRKGYLFAAIEGADISDESIFPHQVQALAQMLHIRYSMLVQEMQSEVKLTTREAQVLELISFGKTNVDIGLILEISSNTVAGYVKNIFIKLDVDDRVSAAMRAQTIRIKV